MADSEKYMECRNYKQIATIYLRYTSAGDGCNTRVYSLLWSVIYYLERVLSACSGILAVLVAHFI